MFLQFSGRMMKIDTPAGIIGPVLKISKWKAFLQVKSPISVAPSLLVSRIRISTTKTTGLEKLLAFLEGRLQS